MSDRAKTIALFALPAAVLLLMTLPRLGWGLPSRELDAALFGDRTPWTGREIIDLIGKSESADAGADVDANPILDRSRPVVVNETDRQRAEIVRRYRLMSQQPDEFATFKTLAEMAGRSGTEKLDPHMYKYGGLWIYPVGALLRVGGMLGLVELRADEAFYLDQPEAFGRFYVVARTYSMSIGLLGVMATAWLAWRFSGSRLSGLLAGFVFAILPVVQTGAIEAKPHLAGASLALVAACFATRFVEVAKRRHAMLAGVFVGAAVGMVFSMLWAFALLPAMGHFAWTRRRIDRAKFAWITLASLAVATAVFVVTNPFVLINAFVAPERITSNLGHSAGFYSMSANGFLDAIQILSIGGNPMLIAIAAVGGMIIIYRHLRPSAGLACVGDGAAGLMLVGPAALSLIQFILLAENKPAEYARFGILPLAAMCVLAFGFFANSKLTLVRAAQVGFAAITLAAKLLSLSARSSHAAHLDLQTRGLIERNPAERLGVVYDPAPWSMPATDLFTRQITLLPRDAWPRFIAPTDVVVAPVNLEVETLGTRRFENVSWEANAFFALHDPWFDRERKNQ